MIEKPVDSLYPDCQVKFWVQNVVEPRTDQLK